MRSWNAIVIGAAVVAVVAVAVLVRLEPGTDAGRERVAGARPPATAVSRRHAAGRSGRVEERLRRIREMREERRRAREQAAAPTPPAEAFRAPTMAARAPRTLAEEVAAVEKALLHHPDPEERMEAVFEASTLDDEQEAIRLLGEALDDPDPEVRLAAVEALGDYADEIPPKILEPALGDPDPEVRFEAVSVLGDMETPEALRLVEAAIEDPDEDVRDLAEGILELNAD